MCRVSACRARAAPLRQLRPSRARAASILRQPRQSCATFFVGCCILRKPGVSCAVFLPPFALCHAVVCPAALRALYESLRLVPSQPSSAAPHPASSCTAVVRRPAPRLVAYCCRPPPRVPPRRVLLNCPPRRPPARRAHRSA